MLIKVNIAETKFNRLSAFNISKIIKPREINSENSRYFKKRLIVNAIARNNGIKKILSWKIDAEDRLFGYSIHTTV